MSLAVNIYGMIFNSIHSVPRHLRPKSYNRMPTLFLELSRKKTVSNVPRNPLGSERRGTFGRSVDGRWTAREVGLHADFESFGECSGRRQCQVGSQNPGTLFGATFLIFSYIFSRLALQMVYHRLEKVTGKAEGVVSFLRGLVQRRFWVSSRN